MSNVEYTSEKCVIQLKRPNSDTSWGFRLQGGIDFTIPLSVQTVSFVVVAIIKLRYASASCFQLLSLINNVTLTLAVVMLIQHAQHYYISCCYESFKYIFNNKQDYSMF